MTEGMNERAIAVPPTQHYWFNGLQEKRTTPPDAFPSERQPPLIINRQQHKKWLNRSNRLASKLASKRYKTLLGKQGTLLDKEKVHTDAHKESGESESGEERTMEAFQTNAFHCSQLKTVEP